MKSRKEAAKLINQQMSWKENSPAQKENNKNASSANTWHYGLIELRELMDFIYNGEPKNSDQEIQKVPWCKNTLEK